MREPRKWDVFCRVVDNFGDAGVCWRLARQLTAEHAAQVRLWIDDVRALQRLHPDVLDVERQTVEGVVVYRWVDDVADVEPPDVVIEAFGCGLPDAYLAAMAFAPARPLWIVVEYLSAEPWVAEHHLLASPHPRSPLERYFYFPGFVPGTGGLLREANVFACRDAFGRARQDAFWQSVGHAPASPDALTVSVFAYEHAPFADLLDVWARGPQRVVAAVSEGRALRGALDYFGAASSARVLTRAALEVRVVPFLPQVRYDELLWSCDCNFVRGEDSFVRAQWAARPLVWHIYAQEERAHWRKLDAFLQLYCDTLPSAAAKAVRDLMRFWNRIDEQALSAAPAWHAFAHHRPVLQRHARAWATRIAALGGLTEKLTAFCREKLK